MLSLNTQTLLFQKLGLDKASTLEEVQARYPKRGLAQGQEVLRMAPSPTGFVHIGTVYASLITEQIAHQSNGVFILRIEDTDTSREVDGSDKQIIQSLINFGIQLDEGPMLDGSDKGAYGPYYQSKRSDLYNAHVVELLKTGYAYPCFATTEEITEVRARQTESKVRPGYYGQYAIWRDRSEADVVEALEQDLPFVLRFRSVGDNSKRVEFKDLLKGDMSLPEDDQDMPLLKADGLPTYHLAHVVDDYLMGTTIVHRGDEWLPSTSLHIGLAKALNYDGLWKYSHFAPISILDPNGGGKRKLSKRKDKEANIDFFYQAGYPIAAIKDYFLGLASADFESWRAENPTASTSQFVIEFERLARSRSPLFDQKKLDDISKNYIGALNEAEYKAQVEEWADKYNPEFLKQLQANPEYTSKVLAVERQDGLENKRKDMSHFSEAPEQYAYFFEDDTVVRDAGLAQLEPNLQSLAPSIGSAFLATYSPADDKDTWFAKVKTIATELGFAPDNQTFKANPDQYSGTVADVAKILRLLLTSKTRTPDLWEVCRVLGVDRLTQRLTF
jgi:glutamyl-tRNA synthetase